MDVVIGLFGNIGFVWRTVEIVPSATEFLDVVVFQREFTEMSRFVIGFESERGAVYFS